MEDPTGSCSVLPYPFLLFDFLCALPSYVWNTQGHFPCLNFTVNVSFRATLNLPENVFISLSFNSNLHRAWSSWLAVVFFSRTKWMVPPSSGFALSSEVSCQPDNPWKVIYLLFLETAFVFCSCNLLCDGMIFFFFFLLRKTLGLLNLLNCSDQFQKIFSHSLQTSPCPSPLLLYFWASAGASRTSSPCPQVSHPLWLHTCLPMPHCVISS